MFGVRTRVVALYVRTFYTVQVILYVSYIGKINTTEVKHGAENRCVCMGWVVVWVEFRFSHFFFAIKVSRIVGTMSPLEIVICHW